MKKPNVWWPLSFSLVMIFGMWTGHALSKKIPEGGSFWSTPQKTSVQEVIDLLEKKYVDPIGTDSLSEDAILTLLSKLDPHSIYIPSMHTAMVNEELKGHFEGIGVEYFIIDDTVHAARILKNGPSEKAGLLPGDKILKVDDSIVAGNSITNDKIRKLLRGVSGSKVTVTVLRGSENKKITITRGTIPRPAVDASYMIDEGIGFLHLNKFSQTAYEEMMASMEDLQKKGMKKLILDLRGNGGGLLEEAIEMADEFLEGNRLVLYTEGTHSPRTDYICKRPGLFEKGDLYILIDETSASAAEVIAGAIQDWDRGTLIGRRSFGKGLVQEPFMLSNGAQLRLTVSRFYTPSGRNIQKPFGKNAEDYNNEVFNRFHHINDSMKKDSANGKAYRTLIKKRNVYGGGGITPDIIIPADTMMLPHPYNKVLGLESINKTMYAFLSAEGMQVTQFKNADDFASSFTVSPSLIERFQIYLKKQGLDLPPLPLAWLEERMKAVIALHLWQMSDYYKISNRQDPFVEKAVSLAKGQ
jgi:carboxyl-terminal processing protease